MGKVIGNTIAALSAGAVTYVSFYTTDSILGASLPIQIISVAISITITVVLVHYILKGMGW